MSFIPPLSRCRFFRVSAADVVVLFSLGMEVRDGDTSLSLMLPVVDAWPPGTQVLSVEFERLSQVFLFKLYNEAWPEVKLGESYTIVGVTEVTTRMVECEIKRVIDPTKASSLPTLSPKTMPEFRVVVTPTIPPVQPMQPMPPLVWPEIQKPVLQAARSEVG